MQWFRNMWKATQNLIILGRLAVKKTSIDIGNITYFLFQVIYNAGVSEMIWPVIEVGWDMMPIHIVSYSEECRMLITHICNKSRVINIKCLGLFSWKSNCTKIWCQCTMTTCWKRIGGKLFEKVVADPGFDIKVALHFPGKGGCKVEPVFPSLHCIITNMWLYYSCI